MRKVREADSGSHYLTRKLTISSSFSIPVGAVATVLLILGLLFRHFRIRIGSLLVTSNALGRNPNLAELDIKRCSFSTLCVWVSLQRSIFSYCNCSSIFSRQFAL